MFGFKKRKKYYIHSGIVKGAYINTISENDAALCLAVFYRIDRRSVLISSIEIGEYGYRALKDIETKIMESKDGKFEL